MAGCDRLPSADNEIPSPGLDQFCAIDAQPGEHSVTRHREIPHQSRALRRIAAAHATSPLAEKTSTLASMVSGS